MPLDSPTPTREELDRVYHLTGDQLLRLTCYLTAFGYAHLHPDVPPTQRARLIRHTNAMLRDPAQSPSFHCIALHAAGTIEAGEITSDNPLYP